MQFDFATQEHICDDLGCVSVCNKRQSSDWSRVIT